MRFAVPFLFSALLAASTLFSQTWTHSNWSRRVAISNLSPVGLSAGQGLTNFPVLIRLSNDLTVKSAHQSDGGDLTFVGMNGSQLFHEIEFFDRPTGQVVAWVCLPFFTNRSALWLYGSNVSASLSFNGSNAHESLVASYPDLTTNAIAKLTWESNFYVVYHFTNATGARPNDSTRWKNDISSIGGSVYTGLQPGIAGKGWYADVGGANVNWLTRASNLVSADPGFLTNRAMSMSMWYKASDFPTNTYSGQAIAGASNYSVLFGWRGQFSVGGFNDGAKASVGFRHDSSNSLYGASFVRGSNVGNVLATNVWGFYSLTGGQEYGVNQTTTLTLNDQVQFSETARAMSAQNWLRDLYVMGEGSTSGKNRSAPMGWFDEFRTSLVIRSSNWQLTEYSNSLAGTNGGSFLTGTNERSPDWIAPVVTANPASMTTGTNLVVTLTTDEPTGYWTTNLGGTSNAFATSTNLLITATTTIWYWGVDAATNVSATNSVTITHSTAPPTLSGLLSSRTTSSNLTLTLAVDRPWGYFTTNGGRTTNQFSNVQTLLVANDLTLLAWTRDAYGNESPSVSARYTFWASRSDRTNAFGAVKNGSVFSGSRVVLPFSSTASPRIEIYAPDGRLVRQLGTGSGEIDLSLRQAVWDGRSSAGAPLPPGLYIVVLKIDGILVDQRKIVWVGSGS